MEEAGLKISGPKGGGPALFVATGQVDRSVENQRCSLRRLSLIEVFACGVSNQCAGDRLCCSRGVNLVHL